MESTNTTMNFLQELFLRLGAKSPRFFNVIKTILMVSTVITGLPQMLIMFGVVLPDEIAFFANKLIAVASFVSLILTSLPVQQAEPEPVVDVEVPEVVKSETVYLPFSNIYALK